MLHLNAFCQDKYVFSDCANASVKLAWDANKEEDLAGYKIYYGLESRNYNQNVNVGNVTAYEINNLQQGQKYYFAATAYVIDRKNNDEYESKFSNEVNTIAICIKPATNAKIIYTEQ